ncbi:conserved hypothetical protein [Burkholderia pseudomallei MSHR346]|nr:hypothetical protein BURPS668_3997 [Burkholderia pseudomallei 668]ACQ95108.1 conserved hypothetical protein [Burkholderia pseudomallei MSHR346]EDU11625.1 hypothetical protein BURPS1655_F0235 [Burkholderia pseudomallei 1655]
MGAAGHVVLRGCRCRFPPCTRIARFGNEAYPRPPCAIQ